MAKINYVTGINPVSVSIILLVLVLTPLFMVPANALTYISITTTSENPIPVLSSISPIEVVAGGGNFTLTLTGSNFLSNSTVIWDETELSTFFINSTTIQANVPYYFILNDGLSSISVSNPEPGGGPSQSIAITIDPKSDIWMTSKSPEGGIVDHLAMDPNNSSIMYAATEAAGIFKSVNGGQN